MCLPLPALSEPKSSRILVLYYHIKHCPYNNWMQPSNINSLLRTFYGARRNIFSSKIDFTTQRSCCAQEEMIGEGIGPHIPGSRHHLYGAPISSYPLRQLDIACTFISSLQPLNPWFWSEFFVVLLPPWIRGYGENNQSIMVECLFSVRSVLYIEKRPPIELEISLQRKRWVARTLRLLLFHTAGGKKDFLSTTQTQMYIIYIYIYYIHLYQRQWRDREVTTISFV